MKTLKLFFVMLLLLTNTVLLAQNDSLPTPDFKKFDTNKDNRLDSTEFKKMNAIYFQSSDSNQDKQLKMSEFNAYAFKQIDKNKDQNLDREEWQSGRTNLFRDCMDAATFDDADTNGDKIVSISEFRESFSKTNCFASYDARTDGQINVQEMSRQLFKNLDKNGDGAIDEKEFQQYNPSYKFE